ncbi:MAG: TatA/E family twin arginine-targeting protein translocase [Vicinamibacterales bacterium]|nr:TatA/E family twin arginine-targeting protein translocase [Vicinamibacterales bacterium]
MGPVGMPELVIILVIALIIFGPRKLPELGKSLGRSLNEFKRASHDLQNSLEQEIKLEEQKEAREKAAQTTEAPKAAEAPKADEPAEAAPADTAVPETVSRGADSRG